jgi:dTDP-4-dehydrorhamnose reductase
MIKILLTGCHGLLGQKVVELCGADRCLLYGVDIHKVNYFEGLQRYEYHRLDITNREGVLALVKKIKPDVIINCAGMTAINSCEIQREECWKVNVEAVGFLVKAARLYESRVIHLSSDYIFNGEAGPYSELDRPDPICYYGKSKLAAENVIQGGGIDGTIIRTTALFGNARKLKPNFVAWLVKRLRDGTEIKIVTDQITSVTITDDVAKSIDKMIHLNINGIFNVAGREVLSKYEFAVKIAEFYNLDKKLIIPTLSSLMEQPARRPLQGGLIIDKAQKALGIPFVDVDEALAIFRQQEAKFN